MMKLLERKKKGNVALESVLAGGMLFMIFVLMIGYFTYLYPRYMVDLEVQNLAHQVKMDGMLTNEDFNVFIENMVNTRGYKEEDIRGTVDIPELQGDGTYNYRRAYAVSVTAADDRPENYDLNEATNTHADGVDPVERNKGQIHIRVTVPANTSFVGKGLNWFNSSVSEEMKYYTVNRIVMSEAYKVPITVSE